MCFGFDADGIQSVQMKKAQPMPRLFYLTDLNRSSRDWPFLGQIGYELLLCGELLACFSADFRVLQNGFYGLDHLLFRHSIHQRAHESFGAKHGFLDQDGNGTLTYRVPEARPKYDLPSIVPMLRILDRISNAPIPVVQ